MQLDDSIRLVYRHYRWEINLSMIRSRGGGEEEGGRRGGVERGGRRRGSTLLSLSLSLTDKDERTDKISV